MKFYMVVYKDLNYYIKWILWPENKSKYFLFDSEIYHYSILLGIKRKCGKYFISWQGYSSTIFHYICNISIPIWSCIKISQYGPVCDTTLFTLHSEECMD